MGQLITSSNLVPSSLGIITSSNLVPSPDDLIGDRETRFEGGAATAASPYLSATSAEVDAKANLVPSSLGIITSSNLVPSPDDLIGDRETRFEGGELNIFIFR
ncbi:MAG TPA: hypothetical protein PK862_01885 [Candidatus Pacearchaeota archaeon]|nr:hypothetical protein [Candidatus Pacearchaeota archaeon]